MLTDEALGEYENSCNDEPLHSFYYIFQFRFYVLKFKNASSNFSKYSDIHDACNKNYHYYWVFQCRDSVEMLTYFKRKMLFFAPLTESYLLLLYFLPNSGLAYQSLTLLYSFIYLGFGDADSPSLTGNERSVLCIWSIFGFLGYFEFNFSTFFEIFLSSCIVSMTFSSFFLARAAGKGTSSFLFLAYFS